MEFRNPQESLEQLRQRLTIAGAIILVCFAVLLARFIWLQIVQYDYYTTRAEENRITLVPVVPNRGLIMDRNGKVLARNYAAFTLEITPAKVINLEQTIDQLGEVLDIQPKDRKRFKKLREENKNFESIPIRTRLTDEEVARFIARRYRFPGVDVKARLFRQYPEGEFASHMLGYIGRLSERDEKKVEAEGETVMANYRGTEHFGKSGLEQHYEFDLHGATGFEQVEVNAGGHAVRTLARTAPTPGNNLTLTVDAELQRIAETAFGARRGAMVAIDPTTGGILAIVSKPTFDPNLFVDGIDSQSWKELNESADKPLLNRALNSANPPGSTFKPFMALAALTIGKRTPGQTIADPGFYNFGGHQFRDDKKGGHGSVDMFRSIAVSCNTYYYMLANDMGIDNISRFMGSIGLGQRTGVDIDGESEGVLPSQEWKKKRFKRPEQQKWYAGETISIGIGQGYNAYTPIQLALATATLANNGVMYRPHLVDYITDAKSGEKRPVEAQPIKTLDWKQEHIDVIKNAMVGVIKEGTGARAFAGAPYSAGGKTGTAQVFSLKGADVKTAHLDERFRDHALFIAFAPVDKPKIALAVLVENAGFGAQSAAPIARQVIDYHLLGKRPNAPPPPDDDVVEAPE
jgi:penicillin-binding protein 2